MSAALRSVTEFVADATLIGWLPAAIVLGAAVLSLVADALGRPRIAVRLLVASLSAAAVLCARSAFELDLGAVIPGVYGGAGLAGTGGLVYALAACAAASMVRRSGHERATGPLALVALSAAACQVLAGAVDLVVMVIALETVAVASYALVAASGSRRAHEVGTRYFVQGSVAAGMAVFSVAAAVGLAAGATGYEPLTQAVSSAPGSAGAVLGVMVLVALAFKGGAFPLHSWVPDAYETIDAAAAAYLAGAPKLAALSAVWILFVRSVWSGDPGNAVRTAVAVMAAASIVYGNFGALKQRNVARMLGYSAIAQAGYALVGVAAGAIGTGLFIAGYAAAVAVAFGCLAALGPESQNEVTLEDLRGLAHDRPVLAASMAVAMLSLTGIPLTLGFVGKLWVFYGAVGAGLAWLAVVGAVGSVVSFGYYGRIIQMLYFEEPVLSPQVDDTGEDDAQPVRRGAAWPFAVLALGIVLAGTAPLAAGFEWLLRMFAV